MNHTYRLIWSHRSHCFVAVGEHARGCGKSARGAALVIAAALAAAVFPVSPAAAGPTGGVVTQGAGSIARPDALTTAITQTSSRLAIDWTSFSSAAGERITFIQPDAFSIALNRVTGRGRSELMGSLVANGQVFLLNPNGVLFGPNASVDVGGLVASTLGMDTNSFMNGSQVLEGGGQGSVVNQGKLTATEGGRDAISGYIALVGPRVINEGAINAQQGQVLMAAGDKVTLTLAGRSLASYTIDRGSLNALVDNRSTGMISASGGQVTLDASAADKLSQAVVNHSGVIEAQTLAAGNKTGSIRLLGGIKSGDREAGDMLVDGTLDVSAPGGGDGGRVETSAARVNIAKSAQVSLLAQELGGNSNGTWTNASRDFLIAKGKGPETSTSIGATTLSQLLSSASRNPATPNVAAGTGDLYVNAPVAWESASKLTLSASRNIYVNADINASKGGSLTLEYGQGTAGGSPNYFVRNGAKIYLPDGDNFSLRFGKLGQLSTYRVISKPGAPGSVTGNDLQGISNAVNNGRYVLGADIDASATKTWNNGAGFVPIGGFNGILDGLGHTISNLYINSTQSLWVGLIRDLTSNGRVQNLTLENADISNNGSSPTTAVGALVGKNDGKIFNAHATMSIKSAYNNAGGLVGINNGEIRNSSAVGTVTFEGARDAEATGGLVGRQVGQVKSGSTSKAGGTIIDSYATVDVIGNRSVGGLVGLMEKSATGIENPTVTGSYAGVSADGRKGSVQGKENVGGLVGYLELGSISDSYAAVPVTGTSASASSAAIGGLVGLSGGTVQRAYARGPVRSDNADKSTVGGLIGKGAGLAFNSFWNTETTGQASSRGGADANGIDTAGMRNLSTFKGWDIDAEGGTGKTWRIYDGQTAPLLRSFLVTKDVEDKSVTYNNARQSGCTGMPCDSAAGNTTFSAASGEYAGTYTPYDLQQGYDIRGGKLTITPVLLTPSVTSTLEKVYDGKTDVYQQDLLSITPLNPGAVTLRYASAQYDNKNAADDRTVSFSGITLDGNSLGNYEIANTFSSGGKITKRALSLVDTKVNDREYDGSKSATLASTPASLGSLVNSVVNDDVSAVNAASVEFVTRNAGENKQVTVNRVTLGGTDAGNYSIAENITVETNARILRRALTLSDTKVDDREYDGTSNAVLNGIGTLNRTVAGDKVTASASGAAFADKTAATNKEVTVSGVVLAGDDAANYTIAGTVKTTASIARRALTLSDTKVDDREYDGTKDATLNGIGTLNRTVAGDKVTASASGAAFADKAAATNKEVTVSGVALAGDDAANYTIAGTVKTTASITRRALTLSDTKVDDREYDGTSNAALNGIGTLNRTVAGDKVTASASGAAFADKTAATNKEVTVSGVVLAGDDAANYTIAGTVKTTASIARRALTLSDTKVDDREYDGTKDATLNGIGTLNRTVAGDKVTASASGAAFADKAAATNKEVTVSGVALAGDDAANYTIAGTVKTTASITRRALTLSDTKVDDREYDGTSNAALNGIGTLNRTVAGDKVTASASGAAFADKTAATNKEVTVSGVVLAGDDAANYTIAGTVKTTASIARRALTLSDTKVDDREYDGTKDATLNGIGTLNRTVAGDKVTASASGAAFADKAAATNKEVTVSGVALAGDDAANYTIAGTVKTTASIRPRPLAVRAQGVDKVYDGNTNASITLGDNRIEGDRLDLRYAKASFADSNAGSGKPVTVAGIAASGVDAGNYMADSNVVTTASIGRAPLTVAANPDSKTFDGKAYRGGNGVSFSGFVAGENVGVLGGQLGYGGNAQGAVEMGSYRILPGGYASQNYAIVYVDGKLTIEAPAVQPANQPGGSLTGATVAALNEIRSMEQAGAMSGDTRPLLSRPTLSIDRCGVRIPRRVLNVMEGDCLAAALQPAAARAVASTRLAGN